MPAVAHVLYLCLDLYPCAYVSGPYMPITAQGHTGTHIVVAVDVQNADELWADSGEAMQEAQAAYTAVLHAVAAENTGTEVRRAGAGMLLSFRDVRYALAFCGEVQKRLLQHDWGRMIGHQPATEALDVDGEQVHPAPHRLSRVQGRG